MVAHALSKLASLFNIMAAVRLIGSLYIYSEAGGVAGQGAARGRSEGAWQHPGRAAGGNGRKPGKRGC